MVLQTKNKDELEEWKQEFSQRGIEPAFSYLPWAVFKCEHEFQLYTPKEELEMCKKNRKRFLIATLLGFVLIAMHIYIFKNELVLYILIVPITAYAFCSTISYIKLCHSLKNKLK